MQPSPQALPEVQILQHVGEDKGGGAGRCGGGVFQGTGDDADKSALGGVATSADLAQ